MQETFRKISTRISNIVGSATAFLVAIGVVVVWAVSGPFFGFSDTWQLIINTGTTIVTFMMVFLIQNTQNRDSKSLHLKLDELIHSTKGARDSFLDLEDLTDDELAALDAEFKDAHVKLDSSKQIHRLRQKISQEKQRRLSLRSAGEALTTILKTPITTLNNLNGNTKDKDKKK